MADEFFLSDLPAQSTDSAPMYAPGEIRMTPSRGYTLGETVLGGAQLGARGASVMGAPVRGGVGAYGGRLPGGPLPNLGVVGPRSPSSVSEFGGLMVDVPEGRLFSPAEIDDLERRLLVSSSFAGEHALEPHVLTPGQRGAGGLTREAMFSGELPQVGRVPPEVRAAIMRAYPESFVTDHPELPGGLGRARQVAATPQVWKHPDVAKAMDDWSVGQWDTARLTGIDPGMGATPDPVTGRNIRGWHQGVASWTPEDALAAQARNRAASAGRWGDPRETLEQLDTAAALRAQALAEMAPRPSRLSRIGSALKTGIKGALTPANILKDATYGTVVGGLSAGAGHLAGRPTSAGMLSLSPGSALFDEIDSGGSIDQATLLRAIEAAGRKKEALRQSYIDEINARYGEGTIAPGARIEEISDYLGPVRWP